MNFKKILVIQTAFLGDVIMSTPVVKALKQTFPQAEIDLVTIPETGIIFKFNPSVSNVFSLNKKGLFKKLISLVNLLRHIRKKKYDLAVSIQSSGTSSLLMYLGKIPNRAGFGRRQKLLTLPVIHEKGLHIRDRYLTLLRPFSDQKFDNQTEIFWSDSEDEKIKEISKTLKNKDKFTLGIAPGSVWHTKKWPREYFISLLKLMAGENVTPVFIGGKNEYQLCQDIIEKSGADALNLAGELTILESTALIQNLDLMLTNDSAPLHMANAVQTDVIAIFGPTVRRFGCYPFRENDTMLEIDLYCRPCSKHGAKTCPEKHFRCMRDIQPELVYKTIKQYIGK